MNFYKLVKITEKEFLNITNDRSYEESFVVQTGDLVDNAYYVAINDKECEELNIDQKDLEDLTIMIDGQNEKAIELLKRVKEDIITSVPIKCIDNNDGMKTTYQIANYQHSQIDKLISELKGEKNE